MQFKTLSSLLHGEESSIDFNQTISTATTLKCGPLDPCEIKNPYLAPDLPLQLAISIFSLYIKQQESTSLPPACFVLPYIQVTMPGLWSVTAEPQSDKPSLWKAPTQDPTTGGLTLAPGSPPTVRRLSSVTANFHDLTGGPSVVVPPKNLHKPSDAHETAAALELAKHRLSVIGDGFSPPSTPPETTTTDSYAFGFDIDGVLIRGGQPVPEAIEAMKMLNGQNEYGIKV